MGLLIENEILRAAIGADVTQVVAEDHIALNAVAQSKTDEVQAQQDVLLADQLVVDLVEFDRF